MRQTEAGAASGQVGGEDGGEAVVAVPGRVLVADPEHAAFARDEGTFEAAGTGEEEVLLPVLTRFQSEAK